MTFTSMQIEADNADEAIARAGEFKGGGHWEAVEVGGDDDWDPDGYQAFARLADQLGVDVAGGWVRRRTSVPVGELQSWVEHYQGGDAS